MRIKQILGKGLTTLAMAGFLAVAVLSEAFGGSTAGAPVLVKVTFNANGGRIDGAATKTVYVDKYESLSDYRALLNGDGVTMSNGIFDGWWTAKTGGREWRKNEEVTSATTLYAHWRKTYALTVNMPGLYLNKQYEEGSRVDVPAPWRRTSGEKVFAGWQVTPATVSLNYSEADKEKAWFWMPTANVTLTPVWIDSPGYLTVEVWGGENCCYACENQVDWSADGKTWFPADGEPYPVKPGKTTVRYRYSNDLWKKIFGTAPKSETFTIGSGEREWAWIELPDWADVGVYFCDPQEGSVTVSPEKGLLDKTFTLTAKPAKDYFFVGWKSVDEYVDGDKSLVNWVYSNPLKFTPSQDRSKYFPSYAPNECFYFDAVFRHRWDMEYPEIGGLISEPLEEGEKPLTMVGVAYEGRIEVNADARPVKFAAKGLPAGLKIDATTGVISGVPTKAGFYNSVITVTSVANPSWKTTQAISLSIEALPSAVVGSYVGWMTDGGICMVGSRSATPEIGDPISVSISSSGAITVKSASRSYQIKSFDRDSTRECLSFYAKGRGSSMYGPDSLYGDIQIAKSIPMINLSEFIGGCVGEGQVYKSIWKDKADPRVAAVLKNFAGKYYTMALEEQMPGYLTFTVDANGTVKMAGKLADGTSLSSSAPLVVKSLEPATDAWFNFAVRPSAYKGGHVCGCVRFSPNGEIRLDYDKDDESSWLDYEDLNCVENYNPQATGEYGEWRFCPLYGEGGVYNKSLKPNAQDLAFRSIDLYGMGGLSLPVVKKVSFNQSTGIFKTTGKYPGFGAQYTCEGVWLQQDDCGKDETGCWWGYVNWKDTATYELNGRRKSYTYTNFAEAMLGRW